mmetsp:Transcript_9011/g.17598  ORF Transcript_9011/g.17598 Transcript_9011/m.17598 type:complete len:224 (+) Transcript_9011:784-1455(+)
MVCGLRFSSSGSKRISRDLNVWTALETEGSLRLSCCLCNRRTSMEDTMIGSPGTSSSSLISNMCALVSSSHKISFSKRCNRVIHRSKNIHSDESVARWPTRSVRILSNTRMHFLTGGREFPPWFSWASLITEAISPCNLPIDPMMWLWCCSSSSNISSTSSMVRSRALRWMPLCICFSMVSMSRAAVAPLKLAVTFASSKQVMSSTLTADTTGRLVAAGEGGV